MITLLTDTVGRRRSNQESWQTFGKYVRHILLELHNEDIKETEWEKIVNVFSTKKDLVEIQIEIRKDPEKMR